jgi:hypothetical protein
VFLSKRFIKVWRSTAPNWNLVMVRLFGRINRKLTLRLTDIVAIARAGDGGDAITADSLEPAIDINSSGKDRHEDGRIKRQPSNQLALGWCMSAPGGSGIPIIGVGGLHARMTRFTGARQRDR